MRTLYFNPKFFARVVLVVLLSFFVFMACNAQVKTTNKKPIPGNDTISMPNDLNVWGFATETTLLYNDKDPERNAMKVTSFRIDSTTVDVTPGQFVYIKNKCILTIKADGRPMIFPYPGYTGLIRLSYVVNDYFTGAGNRAKVIIYIWPHPQY